MLPPNPAVLPTLRIRVAGSDEPLTINARDFDPSVHERYDPIPVEPEPELPPNVTVAREQLAQLEAKAAHLADVYAALGVEEGGDPFAAIAALRTPPAAPPATPKPTKGPAKGA